MDPDKIKEVFQRDRFAKLVGIKIEEVSEGRARVSLKIEEHHLNGVDLVHGGAIFTLADFAFAVASNSHGRVAVGINATISYISPARGGVLFAEAREVSRNPKLGVYEVTVTDIEGKTIALFQGMVYRKKERIGPPVPEGGVGTREP